MAQANSRWIPMDEKLVQALKTIKDDIKDSTYQILHKPQWDKFANDLSNSGANILEEVQQQRDLVRNLEIPSLHKPQGKPARRVSLKNG